MYYWRSNDPPEGVNLGWRSSSDEKYLLNNKYKLN
jgi:hypothetical protein